MKALRKAWYLADEQTAGRGRGDHGWHSAPGAGLYVSVLLRPRVAPADVLWLSLARPGGARCRPPGHRARS